MLKNILKLEGAQELNKTEQKSIAGGGYLNQACYNRCRRGGGGRDGCWRRCCNNCGVLI